MWLILVLNLSKLSKIENNMIFLSCAIHDKQP